MRLVLNMANTANRGFLRASIEETQYLINTPQPEVRDDKKQSVELPGNVLVKAGIERHVAMLHQSHTPRCLLCQNITPNNSQTCRRYNGTGAPPPN